MVHSTPLNELDLVATSAADDAAFVAIHDIATLMNQPGLERALLIGGHMVSLHARRWGLSLFRETQDADLGIPQLALNTMDVVPAFDSLGYNRVQSNRFAKAIPTASADKDSGAEDGQALVDILVPALTSHPRKSVEVGGVTTIEVPGLAEALNREPTVIILRLTRREGVVLTACVKIPDERSALILKTMAWEARRTGKDAVDVWRCLEIAYAAALTSRDVDSNDGTRAMAILERSFGPEKSDGMSALATTQRLNATDTTERATRIRALVARLRG
jgi:hypothetical protein